MPVPAAVFLVAGLLSLGCLIPGCAAGPKSIPLLGPPTPLVGDVAGTVTSGRQLVSGAAVSLSPTGLTSASDAAGSYRFSDVAPGAYLLRVTAPGFAETSRSVTVLAGREARGDIAVAPSFGTGQLTGVVTDGITGVEGVRIQVLGSTAEAISGAGGSFLFTDLSAGLYTVRASRAGFVAGEVPAQVAAGRLTEAALAITRSGGGTLSGRITDGLRGIASCASIGQVVLFAAGSTAGSRSVPSLLDCARSRGVLVVDDRFEFTGLETGTHILQAAVNGFQTGTKIVQIVGGADNNGDMVLTLDGSTSAVAGTVFDSTLLPQSGAQVQLSAGGTTLTTLTGADGRFVVPALTASSATVTVSKQEFNTSVRTLQLSAGDTADASVILQR